MRNLKYNFKSAISNEILDGFLWNKAYSEAHLFGFLGKGSKLRFIEGFMCRVSKYLQGAKLIGWKSLI